MANKAEGKRLGRGLSAVLAEASGDAQSLAGDAPDAVQKISIDRIYANPDQPRRFFDPEALAELTASISEKGVLQPLLVRHDPQHLGGYQIVAGERRWRAAQAVPLHELPVLIRDFDDQQVLEVAIVENVQRNDLNPIEEAEAYQQLIDRFGHTQQEIATSLGKSRSHLANTLRLLALPRKVLDMVADGRLSAGHARTLIGQENVAQLAEQVHRQKLSVRQTEALVKSQNAQPQKVKSTLPKDADTRALEADLTAHLSLKVDILHRANGAGEVKISYKNLEELDGICTLLNQ